MTTLQYAILFNVTQTAVMVLLSLGVAFNVSTRYFRFWTLGIAMGLGLTLAEWVSTLIGWPPHLMLAFLLGSVATSWALVTAGFTIQGRAMPRLLVFLYGGVALFQVLQVFLLKLPFVFSVLPTTLVLGGAFMWLGASFWWLGKRQRQSGPYWMAIPLIAHGSWVLTYPLIVPSSVAWLGYLVIGGFQAISGIGMLIFVLRSSLDAQRRLSRQLQQQNLRLEELDRLKSSFVSVVSHELRTPLTSIKGYAEFLDDGIGGALSSVQRVFVAELVAGSERLERLVDDLLDFARLESGTLSLARSEDDLVLTARIAVKTVQPQASVKAIRLVLELPEAPLLLDYDGRRIEQVLINLMGNAIKFTPACGTVTVRVVPTPGEVRLEVQDTGIGVDPDKLPRLFEQFYQVDPSSTRQSGGVGLGLAIVKSLVEAHGGRVGAESTLGVGSRFWFTLPGEARLPAPAPLSQPSS